MNVSGIIVNDGNTYDSAEIIKKECDILNSAIAEFVSVLNIIAENVFQSGDTHDAIVALSGVVSQLKDKYEEAGDRISSSLNAFVDAVDDADSYLY